MSRALVFTCWWLGMGCSAADPGAGSGGSGRGSTAAAAGVNAGGAAGTSQSSAGALSGGAGSVSGGPSGGGGASAAGAGGSATGGSAGAAAGGAAGASSGCVPSPAAAPSVAGDTVHDPKTCLDWMKTTQPGVNYAAAESFCEASTLGDFDDWRIPSASELASIITLCGKYPPEGPIDTTLFDLQGDGYWTTTSAGEPNKVCAIGMLNAGGYYHYGTAGPQVVRCVRGSGTVTPVMDCTTAQGCMSW